MKPSLANIFSDSFLEVSLSSTVMRTPFGAEYEGSPINLGKEGFTHLPNMNLSLLGNKYHSDTLYEITFEAKTRKNSSITVYTQNGSTQEYHIINKVTDKYGIGFISETPEIFIKYTGVFYLKKSEVVNEDNSFLAFHTAYDTGNPITVRNIVIKKV